ncbi:hypothetical protein V8E54_002884 [Elaphomyces granulatus]
MLWVGELGGILPLSALIDFVEIPPKLHILELAGAREKFASRDCYQDRFGNAVALEVLDGRYGDRYFASSPETLRLVLGAYPIVEVKNDHQNMDGNDLRIQNLEVVHVSRRDPNLQSSSSPSIWRQVLIDPWRVTSPLYLATVLVGWMLLICTIAMSAFFQTWISFTFLLLVPVTGVVVFYLYGSQPRRLLVEKESGYVRLLVVAEHMNSADWLVIYGESTIVNSLVNRPLKLNGPRLLPVTITALRILLRLLILGQWGLALGAAATKNWNSYFICFWIAFTIFSHAFLITPKRGAKTWSEFQVNLKVERYGTRVSSRRTLLNTIVALNPDTFGVKDGAPDMAKFYDQGMKWVDPILKSSDERKTWEKATLEAMKQAQPQLAVDNLSSPKFRKHPGNFLSSDWNTTYADPNDPDNPNKIYWRRFIPEGIYVAAKIKKKAKLPDRKVVKVSEEEGTMKPCMV